MSEPYTIQYTTHALDDLDSLDRAVAKRILRKIERLAENAAIISHYALAGEWAGRFRLRVGDYRVIYTIEHDAHSILIERVGHRSTVYGD